MISKLFKTLVLLGLLFVATYIYAQTPTVRTLDATDRDLREARLNGDVSFGSGITFGQAYFEYGRNQLYGKTTPQRSISASGNFTDKATGLNEDTGYNFRAVLIASDGEILYGSNKTFVTKRIESDITPPSDNDSRDNGLQDLEDEPDGGQNVTIVHTDRAGNSCSDGTKVPVYVPGTTDAQINSGEASVSEYLCPETVAQEELEVPPVTAPAEGDNFRDSSGNSCLGANAQPTYQVPGRSDTAIVGYSCPESGSAPSVGVTVGPITGGSLITNQGDSTGSTGSSRPTFQDPGADGIVNCDGSKENPCGFDQAIGLVQEIINWIVGISVIIAVGLITYSGVIYMTSGGSGSKLTKAKDHLKYGIVGLFFIMFGWLIVNTALNLITKTGDGSQDFLQGEEK